MTKNLTASEKLLARAYALASDEDTKALYRDWAKTYDDTMLDGLAYLTPSKTAQLFSEYVNDKTFKILDVGSGTGLAGQELAQRGYKNIDALDYSIEMLAIAKARVHNNQPVYQTLFEADLNQPLALDDNLYDAMICTGLFTHAHVGAQCLPELLRILKPGSFFATTIHKDIWSSGGFETTLNSLTKQGVLKIHNASMDIYFKTDKEPQGSYILWEYLK